MTEEQVLVEESTEEEVFDEQFTAELEMAKKHGLIKEEEEKEKEDEHTESEEPATEDDKKSEEEVKEEPEEKPEEKVVDHSSKLDDSFDEMSEDPEREHEELKNFSSEQKSFYWKWKKDKKKRQEAVAKAELLELKIKQLESATNKKEDLDSLLEAEINNEEKKRPLTKEEYEEDKRKQLEQQRRELQVRQKLDTQEIEARNKYEDFDDALKSAGEVLKRDPIAYDMYMRYANDPEANAADFVYKLGKINMKPKKVAPKVEPTKEVKKQTSASLKTAPHSGIKKVSYEDMTIEDALSIPTSEWLKVPQKVRNRLLAQ